MANDNEEFIEGMSQVMFGNDYKALYGNREKIDDASIQAKDRFGVPGLVNQIPDVHILELSAGSCNYEFGGTCSSSGVFELISDTVNDALFTYDWEVLAGNVNISGDDSLSTCTVVTVQSATDEQFILQCTVTREDGTVSILSGTYLHDKTIYYSDGGTQYLGTWDASTNTPTLANGIGDDSSFYKVSVAGTVDFGNGAITFKIGDNVIYSPTTNMWEKTENNDVVTSVAGRIGDIVLVKNDVGLGNVDNTSDAAKPISTATQTALNAKEASLPAVGGDGFLLSSTIAGVRSWIAKVIYGDMFKSVYDADDSGVVDDAEKVNGLTVETAVPSGAVFTDSDTIYDDTALANRVGQNESDISTNANAISNNSTSLSDHQAASNPHQVMIWRGLWVDGEYKKNDVVSNDGYLTIANKLTSEKAAPYPIGEPEYDTKDIAFVESQNASVLKMRHIYVANKDGWLKSLFIKTPFADANTIVRITFRNIGTGYTTIRDNVILTSDAWVELGSNNIAVYDGETYEVDFEYYNSTGAATINGGWQTNIGSGVPGTGVVEIDDGTNPTRIAYHNTDLDGTPRDSELQGAVVDSVISINETPDPARNFDAKVTAVDISNSTYTIFTVTVLNAGNAVRDNRTSTNSIDVPITQAERFYQVTNNYPTNNPSWATVTSKIFYDGVEQITGGSIAYGIDILFQEGYFSPDWDIMADGAIESN